MADPREKISTGPNESPVNETIAGTGPGVPDEALAAGAELPKPPTDEEVKRARQSLEQGGQSKKESRFAEDSLPVEGQ